MNQAQRAVHHDQSSIQDFLFVLFRHKWKMLICFLFIVVVVVVMTYTTAEVYESEAKILIRLGRENVSTDVGLVGKGVAQNTGLDRINEVNTEIQLLENETLIKRLVAKLGTDKVLVKLDEKDVDNLLQQLMRETRKVVRIPISGFKWLLVKADLTDKVDPEVQAIQRIKDNIIIDPAKDSNILIVRYQAQEPSLARDTLRELLKQYQLLHMEIYQNKVNEVFGGRFDEVEKKLKDTRDALDAKKKEHNIVSLPLQKESLLQNIREIRLQYSVTRALAEAAESKVLKIEELLDNREKYVELTRHTGLSNPAMDEMKKILVDLKIKRYAPGLGSGFSSNQVESEMKNRLISLKNQEVELASRYSDEHRVLKEVRAQIKTIEDFLTTEKAAYDKAADEQIRVGEDAVKNEDPSRTEIVTGLDATFQSLRTMLDTAQSDALAFRAQEKALKQEVEGRETELQNILQIENEIEELEHKKISAEKDFEAASEYLFQSKNSQLLDENNITNVSVVQEPSYPAGTIRPKKLKNIFLGILVGIFMSIALAFVAEYFDHTLKTDRDVEKYLELPTLVSISDSEFKRCVEQPAKQESNHG